jgi:uncharacterized protein (TIGR02246 family)
MHKKTILLAALFALIALALPWTRFKQSSVGAQESRGGVEDEQTIRKSADDYVAAYNKGDIEAVMAYWAQDADYVDEAGKTHRGKEKIASLFTAGMEDLKNHKLALKVIGVRFIKPDVAIEDGEARLTAPGGETSSSRYTAVWTKTGDRWLLSSVREISSAEPAGESSNAQYLEPLDWVVGEWVSDDKGPKVTLAAKWALDKNFIVMDYTVERKDQPAGRVAQWIGFDPASGQIKSWTFDSSGGHGEGLWTRDGNTWNADVTGVLPDGRVGSARNSLRFVDDTHVQWRSTGRNVEGQPMPDAEVTFVRKAAAEDKSQSSK